MGATTVHLKTYVPLHSLWTSALQCTTLGKTPPSTFWGEICARDTNAALSIICPAQLTAKNFPNFPILFNIVLPDYLVIGMRDELQAEGNSIPLSLEEFYWQLEVRCWPWLLYPVFFPPASNHNRNLKENCPKLSWRFGIQSNMGAIELHEMNILNKKVCGGVQQ